MCDTNTCFFEKTTKSAYVSDELVWTRLEEALQTNSSTNLTLQIYSGLINIDWKNMRALDNRELLTYSKN